VRSSAALKRLSGEVARAVAALLGARDAAAKVLAETDGTQWPRVEGVRGVLARREQQYTLDEAVAEGKRSHERGPDPEDAQGQP
jgi:hypothetical protein